MSTSHVLSSPSENSRDLAVQLCDLLCTHRINNIHCWQVPINLTWDMSHSFVFI